MPGHPRILLVRTDRLGDVILTLPMLPLLRQAMPHAHISLLLNRYTGEVVQGNPHVDTILWYDGPDGLVPFGSMRSAIRREEFDSVVVVHPTLRLAWLMFRAGIPERIGTGYRAYSFLFNRRVYEHRKDARRHELEYNLQLLRVLGCPVPDGNFSPDFSIVVPKTAGDRVAALLRRSGIDPESRPVIVHPGSGGSAREWPIASFGLLAERLAKDRPVIVTGSEGESVRAETVVRGSNGRAVSFAGKLGLMDLAALLGRAGVMISNSTGPLHLAVAVGTPVVGLYPRQTAMSARRWGPYAEASRVLTPDASIECSECTGSPGEHCACMASIGVDQVVRAALDLLGEPARDRSRVAHEA